MNTQNNFPNVSRNSCSIENIELARKALMVTGRRAYRVFYLKNGKEHKSGWFFSEDRARQAYDVVIGKGYKAIIYLD